MCAINLLASAPCLGRSIDDSTTTSRFEMGALLVGGGYRCVQLPWRKIGRTYILYPTGYWLPWTLWTSQHITASMRYALLRSYQGHLGMGRVAPGALGRRRAPSFVPS